jgi:hypothetical protein
MTTSSSDREAERLEVALRCASNAIPVVPWHGTKNDVCTCGDEYCLTPGDHPRVNECTTDPAVVEEHWKKWRKARAVVATGAANIIAVKLKLTGVGRPDEPWSRRPDAWAEREKAEGLPRTVTFCSEHEDVLLFTVPEEDVPEGTLIIGDGITVCGSGEYVRLPQKLGPAGKLVFKPTCAPGEVQIAPAPDWLIRLIIFTGVDDGGVGVVPKSIPLEWIEYPGIEVDEERVKLNAESLRVTNLRNLLYVRPIKECHFALLSDPHELAALELIGLTSANCIVLNLDDDEAELWQIAQVLNQRKLSTLDWAEAVMRWVELVKRKPAQGARPLGGHQSHDKGFTRTGRVLGVSRRDVQRASIIASICAEAKAEIRRLNLNVQRKLLAIGAQREELQLAKLYELTRDRRSEGADEIDIPNGSAPGDSGEQHAEADQEPGGSPPGQAAAGHAVESTTITLQSGDARARQPEGDHEAGACGPGEAVPKAIAAQALITSPSITAFVSDGDNPDPEVSQDFDALALALDQAWDQDCAPIYDGLPDERRRHFIARKLGYVVVAADGVAEPGTKGGDDKA